MTVNRSFEYPLGGWIPMKRRKFIIGTGALFTGSAAAMGTGAVSTMNSGDRTTEVRVANDASSYVGLIGKSRYANGDSTESGKLALDFTGDVTYSYNGDGVNPGSTYTFEDVFAISNGIAGSNEDGDSIKGQLYIYIEPKNFDVDIEFYVSSEEASVPYGTDITGKSNMTEIDDPETIDVGVEITGTSSANKTAGGTIVVHAARNGQQDRL
jgi:hypothetical protein